mgnify:CR=1 FL=1
MGVFLACGLGRSTLVFAVLRKILLEIPLLLLNRLFPLYGLAYAQIVLACAAILVLRRLFARQARERKGSYQIKG